MVNPGSPAGPVIALAMGEKGLACRLLAPKLGGNLTFFRFLRESGGCRTRDCAGDGRERHLWLLL